MKPLRFSVTASRPLRSQAPAVDQLLDPSPSIKLPQFAAQSVSVCLVLATLLLTAKQGAHDDLLTISRSPLLSRALLHRDMSKALAPS